jgi:hypothetical protein
VGKLLGKEVEKELKAVDFTGARAGESDDFVARVRKLPIPQLLLESDGYQL